MLRLISKSALKSPAPKSMARCKFSSDFRKEFGLGIRKASLLKRTYRRFLKSTSRYYIIPLKLLVGVVFAGLFLVILPGTDNHLQRYLKRGFLSIIDELLFMNMKHQPSAEKSRKYINSLVSMLHYWDINGVIDPIVTIDILKKVRDVVENYPMSDEGFSNLFSFLEIRIKRLIEVDKDTLRNQVLQEHISKILERYNAFREENTKSHVEATLFSDRAQSLLFVLQYLMMYNKQKGDIIRDLRRILQTEPTLGAEVIRNPHILGELVRGLTTSDRQEVIKVLEVVSRHSANRQEMTRVNLVNNLVKHIPTEQLSSLLAHFT